MATLALCLEAGKIRAIDLARQKHKELYVILAAILVGLSLLASAGSALVLVEGRLASDRAIAIEREREATAYRLSIAEVQSLDSQIQAVTKKLDETPAEWVGTSRALQSELATLRGERAKAEIGLREKQGGNSEAAVQADMFSLLAQACGIPDRVFLLGFLIIVSVALEAFILCDSVRSDGSDPRRNGDRQAVGFHKEVKRLPPRREPAECEAKRGPGRPKKQLDCETLVPAFSSYILQCTSINGYATRSREDAAAALGISSWQGKTLYRMAVEQGYLATCGRRTRAGSVHL